MSVFRKTVLAFAVVALGLATAAFGQLPGIDGVAGVPYAIQQDDITCNVAAQPLTVRSEGFSELLGSIDLDCSGVLQANPRNKLGNSLVAVAQIPTVNISVTLSVPVTNRVTASSGGIDMMDALMYFSTAGSLGLPDVQTTIAGTQNARHQNPCAGSLGVCSPYYAVDGAGTTTDDLATAVSTTVGTIAAADPLCGAAVGGIFPTCTFPVSTGFVTNVFQSQKQNNFTVVFVGVPISAYDTKTNPRLLAGSAGIPAGNSLSVRFQKKLRITNLRGAIPGAATANGQIFAFISIQNPQARLTVNQATAVVGFVQDGLEFRKRNNADDSTNPGITLAACVSVNRDLAVDATDADPFAVQFLAQYRERYDLAFKIRGYVPGQAASSDQFIPSQISAYNTESGFYNTLFPSTNGLNRAGIADHGTRLRMVIANVPANVRIYVSVAQVTNSGGSLTASTSTTTAGAYGVVADATGGNPAPITVPVFPSASPTIHTVAGGAAAIGGATGVGALIPGASFVAAGSAQGVYWLQNLTSGRATMTWEVYAADPARRESISFAVMAAYRAGNNPGLGTATVQGSFAPVNTTATTGNFLVPIPRFAEGAGPVDAFTIAPCITNLLYPFITNQQGFNTGIAIANTSLTNPGTGELFSLDVNAGRAPMSGTCTLNYFGTTGSDGAAPPPATTGVIPAGRTFTMTLASGSSGALGTVPPAQNFQGYMIAQCNFRYGHGYAFISDIGAVMLAHGYVALVMDTNPLVNTRRTGIDGEWLGM